jgi:hypothetical protein
MPPPAWMMKPVVHLFVAFFLGLLLGVPAGWVGKSKNQSGLTYEQEVELMHDKYVAHMKRVEGLVLEGKQEQAAPLASALSKLRHQERQEIRKRHGLPPDHPRTRTD